MYKTYIKSYIISFVLICNINLYADELHRHSTHRGKDINNILQSDEVNSFMIMFHENLKHELNNLTIKNLLATAINNNSVKIVDFLLHSGLQIEECNEKGETALHIAISQNNLDLIKLLSANNVINIQDDDGYTPLMKAALIGNEEIIHYLISNNANIYSQNQWGEYLLELAAKKANPNIFKLINDKFKLTESQFNKLKKILKYSPQKLNYLLAKYPFYNNSVVYNFHINQENENIDIKNSENLKIQIAEVTKHNISFEDEMKKIIPIRIKPHNYAERNNNAQVSINDNELLYEQNVNHMNYEMQYGSQIFMDNDPSNSGMKIILSD